MHAWKSAALSAAGELSVGVVRRADAPRIGFAIIEVGEHLPRLRPPLITTSSEVVVVQQSTDNERPAEVAMRALRRLSAIEHAGRSIGEAIFGVARVTTRQLSASRELLLRSVIRHMVSSGGGDIVFYVRGEEDDVLEQDLMALGEALVAEVADERIEIAVCFESQIDAPSQSGVRAAIRGPRG